MNVTTQQVSPFTAQTMPEIQGQTWRFMMNQAGFSDKETVKGAPWDIMEMQAKRMGHVQYYLLKHLQTGFRFDR